MINLDSEQKKVFSELKKLKSFLSSNPGFFSKIFQNKSKPKSLYIYGRVGRGKSMLMRKFFDELKTEEKLYVHFNSFMQKIHRQLHDLRKKEAPENIIEVAIKNIIGDTKILCFDEFQVEDVTDALILRKIFSYLFAKDILVVCTSNSHPKDLYQNGLQRESFLKFVEDILLKNCLVLNLDAGVDYRRNYLQNLRKHYFYPLNQENKNEIEQIIKNMSDDLEASEIEVLGRKLTIPKACNNVAVFDFKELFNENFGIQDYQAICQKFSVIFLLNIPMLNKEEVGDAKRLMLFIDEVYESKTALILSAETKIDEIYPEGIGAEAFKRTASRLNEIISDEYWNSLN